jgi:hypothetical protein
MAKEKGDSNQIGTPREYPQVTPPVDLYPTSDIRFVMVELGKLSTKVDRLIDDVKTNSEKTSKLSEKVEKFETTIKVGGALIVIFMGFIWWFVGDHIKTAVTTAMRAGISENAVRK